MGKKGLGLIVLESAGAWYFLSNSYDESTQKSESLQTNVTQPLNNQKHLYEAQANLGYFALGTGLAALVIGQVAWKIGKRIYRRMMGIQQNHYKSIDSNFNNVHPENPRSVKVNYGKTPRRSSLERENFYNNRKTG